MTSLPCENTSVRVRTNLSAVRTRWRCWLHTTKDPCRWRIQSEAVDGPEEPSTDRRSV